MYLTRVETERSMHSKLENIEICESNDTIYEDDILLATQRNWFPQDILYSMTSFQTTKDIKKCIDELKEKFDQDLIPVGNLLTCKILHWTAVIGDLAWARALLERLFKLDTECNFYQFINEKDDFGEAALHIAARRGHDRFIDLLLEFDAQINLRRSHDNKTALHISSMLGHYLCCHLLLNKCPSLVHSEDSDLQNPLLVACDEGKTEIVKLLLKHGASGSARDKTRSNALHHASRNGSKELLEILLNVVSIDSKNANLETPLLIAAKVYY